MTFGQRILVGLCASVLAVGLAGGAQALPYTLASSVGFSLSNGAIGTIDPVTSLAGTVFQSDGAALDSSATTQDVFVVDVTLDGSSDLVDAIGIAVLSFSGTPVGAGSFLDGGTRLTSNVDLDLVNGGGLYEFTFLNPNETSARLYLSHSAGDFFTGFPNTVNFMISSGVDETVQGTLVLIPEPGTLLLVGGMLLALAAARSRERSPA